MRSWLQNGLLALGTAIALAGVGEVAVRAVSPFPSWQHEQSCAFPDRFDARLGWSGIPHHDGRFAQREFEIRVETNGAGFRDEDFAAKRARAARDGSRRVALLGDSFVWGWGVDAAERVGERLEALARGAGAAGLTSFNLAQCGYGTDQQYLAYLAHADLIEPELALLFFFANDFADVNAALRYEGQAKPRFHLTPNGLALANVPVPYDALHWERKRALAARRGDCRPLEEAGADGAWRGVLARLDEAASHLQLANWLGFRLAQLAAARPRSRDGSPPQPAAQAGVALALVDALAAQTTRDGARFALVLVPEKGQVLAGEREGVWQQILMAHCARAGLACLDLLPDFAGDASTYFRVDPHWNAAGHRRAAERVHAFLTVHLAF